MPGSQQHPPFVVDFPLHLVEWTVLEEHLRRRGLLQGPATLTHTHSFSLPSEGLFAAFNPPITMQKEQPTVQA